MKILWWLAFGFFVLEGSVGLGGLLRGADFWSQVGPLIVQGYGCALGFLAIPYFSWKDEREARANARQFGEALSASLARARASADQDYQRFYAKMRADLRDSPS